MAYLTVIRHAPTPFNNEKIFMGSLDIPCINIEMSQIKAITNLVNVNEYSICYTSPLNRALCTANALFDKKIIKVDSNLIERSLGIFEGKYKDEIKLLFPEAFSSSGILDITYTPAHGETCEDLINRVKKFLESLLIYKENEKIAVITHNGVCKAIEVILNNKAIQEVFNNDFQFLMPQTYSL